MNETDARRVMLVRAVELTDTAYSVWSREDRKRATEAAHAAFSAAADGGRRETDPAEESFLARRAELACVKLEREHPAVARVRRSVQWPRGLVWLLPLTAFALGFAANELSAGRRISIISFPLLGMLAWNGAVYALTIAGAVTGVPGRARLRPRYGAVTRLLMRIVQPFSPRHAESDPLERGLGRFVGEWLRISSPLGAARARAVLHLSAALLAAGAIAGLYVRGLGLEYLAGWESTFLNEHALHRVLRVVLGAASALSGIPIPGPEHLATLRWSAAQTGENAARWIHLYALTAALFIVVPRLVLALGSALSAVRLQRAFALPIAADPYFRRLLSMRQGRGERVRVIPYSYRPDAPTQDALRALFAEISGDGVQVEFDEPVAYGEGARIGDVRGEDRAPDYVVVLFNIAATPEDENLGVLLAGVRESLREGGAASRLLIILNESPYRRRFSGQGDMEARLAERRRAWEAALRARGAHAVSLDLEGGDPAGAAKRLETSASGDAALLRTS